MSEIEFLTKYSVKGLQVVYIGAAPGTHIHLLAQMFPELEFILYDPQPFRCLSRDNIQFVNERFTDEMARKCQNKRVLFISDIRCVDSREAMDVVEKSIENDMIDQMRWHQIMKPRASCLKFRLPWDTSTTKYLDGTMYVLLLIYYCY
jgi:23S rRNA U2552 (ribose-2'-O)-methylase RlmE/FtsJ